MTLPDLKKELEIARTRLAKLETENEVAECAMDMTLEKLIFENIPGGMAVIGLDGSILVPNSEASQIIGYTTEEIVKLNASSIICNRQDLLTLLKQLKQGKIISGYPLMLRCKDNSTIWTSFSAKPIEYGGSKAALITFTDITKHKQALKELELDEIRFEMLYTISGMIHKPEKDILNFALDAIVKVTDSEFGYIFHLNEDETELSLHAWSTDALRQCKIKSMPRVFKIEDTGLWGNAVRQRKPIITNDYMACPNKRGHPEGHVPIIRHMNIPVFEGKRITFVAGVGNKDTEYTKEDIRQLDLVMDGTTSVLHRKRAITAMEKAHDRLEERVQDRTAKLQKANEDFARLTTKLIKQDKERELAKKTLIRYERIISSSPDLISLIDQEHRFVMVNDAYEKAFGIKQEAIIGHSIHGILEDTVLDERLHKNVDKTFNGEVIKVETWVNFPTLGKRFMAVFYHPVSIEEGIIEFVSIEARDMTDLKTKEEALREAAERLDLATDAGNIGIWEWDLLDDDTIWDNKMHELYKVTPGEFDSIYDAWRTRLHEEDLPEIERELADCIAEKKRFDTEFRIVWPDGSVRFIRAAASLRINEDGVPFSMTGVNWDVTDRRTMEIELRRLASTDPLTGASNRRHFMDRLQAEFERCKRYSTPMVLLSIDIDHFKKINDSFGHPDGDEVLKDLVQRCKATLRTTDVFGRVGGEEFLAALTQTSNIAGERTAERLRSIIESNPVSVHGNQIPYTISIGLTGILDEDSSIEPLLKRADEALYKAKNNGRNRVEKH
ncbi:diguanylate cyclase [Pseudodesulfovibrio sediminis]|uniref:Diguanylate cyclase n=1 Tax=Pseudodesulfovibrio sediminis TaxID=2810563 RepID=A0ABM7P626_9BACT|nr:diguanylate cyclase [Pseudodesulfovibrio sediminis]BCS88257.1 hypothetical protein PSDVSF_14990 [Pseudodesulfovibrio sediminis]